MPPLFINALLPSGMAGCSNTKTGSHFAFNASVAPAQVPPTAQGESLCQNQTFVLGPVRCVLEHAFKVSKTHFPAVTQAARRRLRDSGVKRNKNL